jgi:hypothetical protein
MLETILDVVMLFNDEFRWNGRSGYKVLEKPLGGRLKRQVCCKQFTQCKQLQHQ